MAIKDGDSTESTSIARHAVIKLTGSITGNQVVTVPDSIEKVLDQVKYFLSNGVDIIDLGAQSTRPGAEEIGPINEIKRLIPCLKAIRSIYPEILISIDTVQRRYKKEKKEINTPLTKKLLELHDYIQKARENETN